MGFSFPRPARSASGWSNYSQYRLEEFIIYRTTPRKGRKNHPFILFYFSQGCETIRVDRLLQLPGRSFRKLWFESQWVTICGWVP